MAEMPQESNPIADLPELSDEIAAPSVAPVAPRKPYPQLWKFLWGGILVAVGVFLPFGPRVLDRMLRSADAIEKAKDLLPAARPGTETLGGTIFLVLALLLIGQMSSAIRERKIALGTVLLMIIPCAWSWMTLFSASAAINWPALGELFAWNALEALAAEFGTGFVLVWLGATLVEVTFVLSLVKVFTGPKSAPVPARASAVKRR